MISPLALLGEKNPFPSLLDRFLLLLNGDGVMNLENHLNQFLAIYDIHSVIEDDFMVNFFYEIWLVPLMIGILSPPESSFTCFTDREDTLLNQYSQLMAYHMILT